MDAVRTCLGCRARTDKSSLLRVVVRDGVVVPDVSGTLSGRGAWVHPTTRCVEASISRKAFARALRASAPLDTGRILKLVGPQPAAREEQAD